MKVKPASVIMEEHRGLASELSSLSDDSLASLLVKIKTDEAENIIVKILEERDIRVVDEEGFVASTSGNNDNIMEEANAVSEASSSGEAEDNSDYDEMVILGDSLETAVKQNLKILTSIFPGVSQQYLKVCKRHDPKSIPKIDS